MLLIAKLINTGITMVSQILHLKIVMKIIERLLNIDHISRNHVCLSITRNYWSMALRVKSSFQLPNVSKVTQFK